MSEKHLWAQKQAEEQIKLFETRGDIKKGWSFRWNRKRCYLGLCDYNSKTIQLSMYYVEAGTKEDIFSTIIHELCHSVTGPGVGHGKAWKKACIKFGCKPLRCSKYVDIPAKYTATCSVCNHTYKLNRRKKDMDKLYCGATNCKSRSFFKRSFLVWKDDFNRIIR